MSIARRIAELEEAAMRRGHDALSQRMGERLRHKTEAELTATRSMLEEYMTTGEAMPGLAEIIEDLTK